MPNPSIPPSDHVVRWCKASEIDRDTGEVGPGPFLLSPKDTDGGISVNWLEHCHPTDLEAQLQEVREVLAKKMKKISVDSRLARLNIGRAIASVAESSGGVVIIDVVHSPEEEPGRWIDASHALVSGLTIDDEASAVSLRDSILGTYVANS